MALHLCVIRDLFLGFLSFKDVLLCSGILEETSHWDAKFFLPEAKIHSFTLRNLFFRKSILAGNAMKDSSPYISLGLIVHAPCFYIPFPRHARSVSGCLSSLYFILHLEFMDFSGTFCCRTALKF